MSGAIGIEQLKKLPQFIEMRVMNAKYFVKLFSDHQYIDIQKEIGISSWFGFSIVLKENSPISRRELVNSLTVKGIECRPIVTGNFLKNKEVLEYFDFEVFGTMENSEYIDMNGLFVGNQQINIEDKIDYLYEVINQAMSRPKQ
jgi:dTDP-4-amino-4,6-dideoxygalactose transaminase